MNKLNILICSGFTETELVSFRENQYPRILSLCGHSVVLVTSNRSYIWKFNRAKSQPTNPEKHDCVIQEQYGYKIKRKAPFFRIGDFILLPIPVRDILRADVVHVIEFRQGNSVLVAAVAKLFGKPVVYDHEQRGDRHYTIYHDIDSLVRRFLIGLGSLFVDYVRHTVVANGEHYLKNAWKKPKNILVSPLAADERIFFYDANVRKSVRLDFGFSDNDIVFVVSGKLNYQKRTDQVIEAICSKGHKVVVAGTLDEVTSNAIKRNQDLVIYAGNVNADKLNQIYNASDVAVFTTFSVSYWEALATGLKVLVPRTRFSEKNIDQGDAILFGGEFMFDVVEEQYKEGFDLTEVLTESLNALDVCCSERKSNQKYTWNEVGRSLMNCYNAVLGI